MSSPEKAEKTPHQRLFRLLLTQPEIFFPKPVVYAGFRPNTMKLYECLAELHRAFFGRITLKLPSC
jgi:hypothetical protein